MSVIPCEREVFKTNTSIENLVNMKNGSWTGVFECANRDPSGSDDFFIGKLFNYVTDFAGLKAINSI